MTIRFDPVRKDAQGLPVVSWKEERNLYAPEGFGPARAACYIKPDKKTGILQFVATGSVRHGQFEEARPWQALRSFEVSAGRELYPSAGEKILLGVLADKSKSGAARLLANDGSMVILANFEDDRSGLPMHLNCAEASPVEMAALHDRLHREFIARRDMVLRDRCQSSYLWSKRKRFAAYRPPAPAVVPKWKDRLVNATVAALFGLIGFGLYRIFWS